MDEIYKLEGIMHEDENQRLLKPYFLHIDGKTRPYPGKKRWWEHSLMPYLHVYRYNNDNLGYVLMEPETKQLFAIDTGDFKRSYEIITNIEKKYNASLRYILSTHHH